MYGTVFGVENSLSSLDIHRPTSYTENIGECKWLILPIDVKEMIYESLIHQRDTALYTDDPIYIYLLEKYVRHDILVNRIVQRTGKDMDGWGTKWLFAPNIRKANFSNYYVKYGLFLLQQ